jgi:predicted enzyme related to lactoylglutathione lyase
MALVEHFEIPADDMARAQAFYKNALDFDYEPWGDDMGMLKQPASQGINGDLHQRSVLAHPTVVFTVANIEQTVATIVAYGGSQVGEIERMGETARWVYVKDSEGNTIGLYDDVSATD